MVDLGRQLIYQELLYVRNKTGDPQPARDLQPSGWNGLTPQTAQVTTASVEIKTLTVSGKQVTMAVFRQLYEEPLYDLVTWEPAGAPWCRVNYHPDKCANHRPHEHVVWQKGDELRRDRIVQPYDGLWDVPEFGHDDEAALCLAAGGVPDIEVHDSHHPNDQRRWRELAFSYDHCGTTAEGKLLVENDDLAALVYQRNHHGGGQRLRQAHTLRHPDISGCVTTMEIVERRAKQTAAWQNAANRRWNEIRALGQVFIAV